MKQLICVSDVEEALSQGKKELSIDQDAIITPAAKDLAAKEGLSWVEQSATGSSWAEIELFSPDKIYQVLSTLAANGLLDTTKLALLFNQAVHTDATGIRLVKTGALKAKPVSEGKMERQLPINASSQFKEITFSAGKYAESVNQPVQVIVLSGKISAFIQGRRMEAEAGDVFDIIQPVNFEWVVDTSAKIMIVEINS